MSVSLIVKQIWHVLPEEEHEMMWMIPYLNGVPASIVEKTKLKQFLTTVPVMSEMPRELFDWPDFVKTVKHSWEGTF